MAWTLKCLLIRNLHRAFDIRYVSFQIFLFCKIIVCVCWCFVTMDLSPKYFNFPLPITLTMIHMGFSGAVTFFLVRVFKVCYAIFCVVLYFGNMLLFPDLWSILIWLPLIFNVAKSLVLFSLEDQAQLSLRFYYYY